VLASLAKIDRRGPKEPLLAFLSASHYRGGGLPNDRIALAICTMKFQELLILLPCHSLEDFPTYHEGDDAHSLLASWWPPHPELPRRPAPTAED
jgi:hypothetical protein